MRHRTGHRQAASTAGLPASLVESLSTPRAPARFQRFADDLDRRNSRPFVVAGLSLLLAVALSAITVTARPVAPVAAAELDDESLFVALVNDLRADQGLPLLTVDPDLTRESRLWAETLRADGALSHAADLSVGVDAPWLKLGENVGVGPVDRVDELFDAFVASPDHFANLIDPSFEVIGVGVVYDSEGRLWTTHRFMDIDNAALDAPQTGDPTPETPDDTTVDENDNTPVDDTATDPVVASPDDPAESSDAGTGDDQAPDALASTDSPAPQTPSTSGPDGAASGQGLDVDSAGDLFGLLAR